jgi:hypothetical protein
VAEVAVHINEVVMEPADPPQPTRGPGAPTEPAPDPAKAEEELVRMLHRLRHRAARLHAC